MFEAFITRRLIAKASDETKPGRLDAIRALGERPLTDELIACLARIVRDWHDRPTHDALFAAQALGRSSDPRVSTVLAGSSATISSYDVKSCIIAALSHPRHAAAVPAIVAAARHEADASGWCDWLANTLAAIASPEAKAAWDKWKHDAPPFILRHALALLKSGILPGRAEGDLEGFATPEARTALATLRRAMVHPLAHVALTATDYDGVGEAVAKLQALAALGVEGAGDGLNLFLSPPGAQAHAGACAFGASGIGAMQQWTEFSEASSRDFGQR